MDSTRDCKNSKYYATIFLAAAALALGIPAQAVDITGAGATFPYPIYAKWAEAYKAKTGVGMNYQSIGSGGGIKQIQAKTVDFGASDMPMKPEELEKAGLMQFPAIIGGIVPVVNVEGVAPGALKLTGPVLADIYLGKIKTWDDKAITALNAALKLRAEPITVVRRSDGSRHDVQLHRLPLEGEPRMEGKSRLGHRGCVARRRRRQGQRGCRLVRAAHQGLDRLRRIRVRQEEHDDATCWCRTRTASIRSRTHRLSRRLQRRPTGRTRLATTRSSPTRPARTRGRSPRRASS